MMADNLLTTLEKLVRDGQKYNAASYKLPLGMMERILAKMQADEETIEVLRLQFSYTMKSKRP